MPHTQILLREDIDDLGARGDIVKVKAGYARNYLLPRKLAVQATTNNVKQIEQERAALLKKEAGERSTAEAQGEQMRRLSLTFERRVGEHGLLYGSVTSMDIAEALKERGYEIDRRRINLREAIKEAGESTVSVRLHREVVVEISVIVVDERAAKTAAAVPSPAVAPKTSESSEHTAEGKAEETANETAEGAET